VVVLIVVFHLSLKEKTMNKDKLKGKLSQITQLVFDLGLATSNRYTNYQERLSQAIDEADESNLKEISSLIDESYNKLKAFDEEYSRLRSRIKSL
jgi:cob(I)alamin adenosyltransferase